LIDREIGKKPECLVLKFEKLDYLVASGFTNGHIIVNHTTKGLKKVLKGQDSPISSLRWKPHSQLVPKNVLLSINTQGEIIYWHVTSGKILHKIEETGKALLCLDYNKEGTIFAIGGEDKTIRVYDEFMKIMSFKFNPGNAFKQGHQDRINSIVFHKNKNNNYENILASGGWDSKICLYDLRVKSLIGAIDGPYICGDSLDLKEHMILCGSYSANTQMQIYDLRNYKLLTHVDWDKNNSYYESNIYSAQFSKTGPNNLFAIGCSKINTVRMYDVDDEFALFSYSKLLDKPVYSLDFSNTGNLLAFSGADADLRIIKIVNLKS
jgi:COMPASS component SWD3